MASSSTCVLPDDGDDDESKNTVAENESERRWTRIAVGVCALSELKRARIWSRICDDSTVAHIDAAIQNMKFDTSDALQGGVEERLARCLRSSAQAYLELYSLAGGNEVKGSSCASQVVRSASRMLRDVMAWRSFSLCGLHNAQAYLDVLDAAFDGKLCAAGHNDLKAKMSHTWSKERASLGLEQERMASSRKGKKKKKTSNDAANGSVNSSAYPVYGDWAFPVHFYPWLLPPFDAAFASNFRHPEECVALNVDPSLTAPAVDDDDADGDDDLEANEDRASVTASVPDTVMSYPFYQPRQHLGFPLEFKQHVEGLDTKSIPDTEFSWRCDPAYPMKVPNTFARPTANKVPLQSIADEEDLRDFEVAESSLPMQACETCKEEGSDGWHDRHQHYYCKLCWEKWYREWRSRDNEETVDGIESSSLQRYEAMEPIYVEEKYDTIVEVENICSLRQARLLCQNNSYPCVVILSATIIVESVAESWPLSVLWKRTSFKRETEAEPVVPHGGFHVDITCDKDEFGEDAKPFNLACVFGKLPGKMDEFRTMDEFRKEMRSKISVILRICYTHRHQDIIISSKFNRLLAREVAALFHEVLLESTEFIGAFRHVTFALLTEEVSADVFLGFREAFRYSPREDLSRDAWKAGSLLAPCSKDALCLVANLKGKKLSDVRGTEVQLSDPVVSAESRRTEEHQKWIHLPCGRIVLAAFPGLCLSAKTGLEDSDIHIWHKVEKNEHLQTWRILEDGSIALACDLGLRMNTRKEDKVVRLLRKDEANTVWKWQQQVDSLVS